MCCSCVDLADEIKAFVSISSPFPCYWALSLFNCTAMLGPAKGSTKPKLLICGDGDQFSSTQRFEQDAQSFLEPCEAYLCEGRDHFWFRCEAVCAALILRFLQAHDIVPKDAQPEQTNATAGQGAVEETQVSGTSHKA